MLEGVWKEFAKETVANAGEPCSSECLSTHNDSIVNFNSMHIQTDKCSIFRLSLIKLN